MQQYFVKRGSNVGGPYELAKIRAAIQNKKILPTDLFCESANGPWMQYAELAQQQNRIHQGVEGNAHVSAPVLRNEQPNGNQRLAPATASKEVSGFTPWGLIAIVGGTGLIGVLLGLLLGFVLWAGRPNDPVKAARLAADQPVKGEGAGESSAAIPNGGSAARVKNSEENQPRGAEVMKETIPVSDNKPDQPSPDTAGGHEGAIKKLIETFYTGRSPGLKGVYSLCVEDEEALELLSTFSWDTLKNDAIVTFGDFPDEAVVAEAIKSGSALLVPFKYNAKPREYVVRFMNNTWKIDYVKSWKKMNGLDKEQPVTVGVLVFRKPRDTFQHEVHVIVVNDSNLTLSLTGKAKNPVAEQPVLLARIEPGRTESTVMKFHDKMLLPMVLDGPISLECDVFPAGAGVDGVQKKYLNPKFVISDDEFDKFTIICRQPHDVAKRSDTKKVD